jgi:conjugal transfer pilus assembly protein TraU
MIKKFLSLFLAIALGASQMASAGSSPASKCNGKFPDVINDICWSCMFPMTMGGIVHLTKGQEDNTTTPGNPVCACGLRFGTPVSFWEPVRIIEMVRTPYCFPTLSGMSFTNDINQGNAGVITQREGEHGRATKSGGLPTTFYNVHWYVFPVLAATQAILDSPCLEAGYFDMGYLTEVDPLWQDSKKTFLINPDGALFANVIAELTCPLDCVTATAGFPIDSAYWCSGCNGNVFPLDGFVGSHVGMVQATSLLTTRMLMKMHREGLIFSGSGSRAMCGLYWDLVMSKSNYKTQMIYPIPNTGKINGHCCNPIGRTTVLWGAGKEFPVNGEDAAYLVFKKRDCCQGAFSVGDWMHM